MADISAGYSPHAGNKKKTLSIRHISIDYFPHIHYKIGVGHQRVEKPRYPDYIYPPYILHPPDIRLPPHE